MNRLDLVEKLDQARPFLLAQDFIPILTHFCFDKDHISAYNDVAGLQLSLDTELNCAVPGNLLLKMLGTMTDETVRVEAEGENILKLKTGKTDLKLPVLTTNEFVFELPDLKGVPCVTITQDFLRGLRKCLISIGKDPSHPETTGVTWVIKKKKVSIYSTDNKSLSKYSQKGIKIKHSPKDGIGVITPAFFCEQLLDLVPSYLSSDESFKIYFSDKFAVAKIGEHGDCYLFTRLISNEIIIDFEKVLGRMIEGKENIPYTDIPDNLVASLERAVLLLTTGGTITTSHIKVDGDTTLVETESPFGKARDFVIFTEDLGKFFFEVDPELIQKGLKVTSKIALMEDVIAMRDDANSFLHLISHSNTSV